MASDEQSPLDVLDAAVQAFINGHPDHAGAMVAGWSLGFQVANADEETGDLWWDVQYCTGPSTNPASASGIFRVAEAKLMRDLVEPDGDGDGDGDG